MLSAIREIGRWQINKDKKDELDILIKEPFGMRGKVILIKVNIEKNAFEGIDLEEYDSVKIQRYLFRGGVSQGPNPTPVANIPNVKQKRGEEGETYKKLESQIRKTFEGKIKKWFEKYGSEEKENFLGNIKKILSDNEDKIIKEIQTCIKDIDKKEGKLLTIKVKQDNEWKYIGDFDVFKESLKRIEAQKAGSISASDKVCSVCGVRKESVSGDFGVFKFYTIDKPGFVIGGFNEKLAWKNFPVCLECKLELEEGRKFIENNLSFGFYGLRYLLIPKLILGDVNVNAEIINILSDSKKIVALKERVKKRITSDNNEILKILGDEKDILTFNFLFLSREQSAERILLLIEDIFPYRIKKIFEAKDYIDRIFNNDSDKGFTFGAIRTFFYKSSEGKRESDLNKYFLEIVDSVFKGRRLDFSFLLKFYMATIRKEFISDGYFMSKVVKDALMDTIFFEKLGIITFEEVNMEESIFDTVFKKFEKSFGTPAKRGIFLLGVLTQLLLNKQWADRNARPFMKYLKGLKLNEKDIKAILPKVQNKLEEYGSFDKSKRLIASEASKCLLEAGEGWKMTTDEINFYFACGMNLVDDIRDIVYLKSNEKEE
ncbi:MAG: TIGR02556 family CRISPR-associated protein [Candidatus Omnitrophica bacterium]|nr:TIGR02556 family CRISPR-associated protein [Candidatus Omnitrophota bacterium]